MGLWFRKKSVTVTGKHGQISGTLRVHLPNFKQQAESKRKRAQVFKLPKPVSMTFLLSLPHNCTTNWGPSVQMPENIEGHLLFKTTTFYSLVPGVSWPFQNNQSNF